MIAIDTSAILAILLGEAEADLFQHYLEEHDRCITSVATALELHLVCEQQRNNIASQAASNFITVSGIELVPVDTIQLTIAKEAYTTFGNGRHPAGLNFGDCFSYALAKSRDVPLLYKGNDFGKTDITSASHLTSDLPDHAKPVK